MEWEMGTVGFIDQDHDVMAPAELDDRLQSDTTPVVGRIDYEQGLGVEIVQDGLFTRS